MTTTAPATGPVSTTRTAHTMTPDQLAAFLQVDRDRLYDMRAKGTGPRFVKVGRDIRYLWPDVRDWLQANTHQRTPGARTVDA